MTKSWHLFQNVLEGRHKHEIMTVKTSEES